MSSERIFLESKDRPPQHRLLFKPLENCHTEGCHMDVWLPNKSGKEQTVPLVIFIHGGGFTVGSSADIAFNQLDWYLEQGIACCSIEYRLMPHVTHREIREDLLDAYRFIQNDLAAKLPSDGPQIDPKRCVVTGGSAGGSSSLYLALDAPRAGLPPLLGVLSSYPLVDANNHATNPRKDLQDKTDPATYAEIEPIYKEPVCVSEPYLPDVFTKSPPRTPRQLWIKAAAMTRSLNSFLAGQDAPYPSDFIITDQLTSSFPPTVIWCAIEDTDIPVEQSYMLEKRLQELGVECHAHRVQAPHGFADLPMRYFPDRAQGWWDTAVLPGLEWAKAKLNKVEA